MQIKTLFTQVLITKMKQIKLFKLKALLPTLEASAVDPTAGKISMHFSATDWRVNSANLSPHSLHLSFCAC